MSTETDELVIELEGDTVVPDKIVTIEPDKKPDDAAVAGFKEQLTAAQAAQEAEKRRADDATARATTAEQEAARLRESETKARGETVESQIDAVANAINAATAEGDAAERDYAAAMSEGDFARAATAQRKMSGAEARLAQLNDAKSELDHAKKSAKPAATEREAVRGNPVDQFIASRTAPTATWLRAHPDVADSIVRGGDIGQIVAGADAEARRKNIKLDTDEYFHLIETRLGLREEKRADAGADPDPDSKPRKKPVGGAPMSRETTSDADASANRVTLTRGEQNNATDGTLVWTKNDKLVREGKAVAGQPIGLKEMARRKQAMGKQGYYDRAAVE